MSDILLSKEELKENEEMLSFLKTLTPEMQEKLKIIVWWENLKGKRNEIKTGA